MWGQYYCYTQIVILKMKEQHRKQIEESNKQTKSIEQTN